MLDSAAIQSAVDRMIAKASSPSRVILFGSYARGAATAGSDLDLAVIERRSLVPGNVLYHACREGKILHDSIN